MSTDDRKPDQEPAPPAQPDPPNPAPPSLWGVLLGCLISLGGAAVVFAGFLMVFAMSYGGTPEARYLGALATVAAAAGYFYLAFRWARKRNSGIVIGLWIGVALVVLQIGQCWALVM